MHSTSVANSSKTDKWLDRSGVKTYLDKNKIKTIVQKITSEKSVQNKRGYRLPQPLNNFLIQPLMLSIQKNSESKISNKHVISFNNAG